MNTAADARLAQSVSDELAALRGFIKLLQQEQQALTEGDIDRLMPLVAEKARLASTLGQLADQRNELLMAAGLPNDRAGMESWLDRQRQTTQVQIAQHTRNEWESLMGLAVEARALNETNGKLIGTRLQHNQQTLNALLAAGDRAALYGPDGQTRTSGGGRLFGAA